MSIIDECIANGNFSLPDRFSNEAKIGTYDSETGKIKWRKINVEHTIHRFEHRYTGYFYPIISDASNRLYEFDLFECSKCGFREADRQESKVSADSFKGYIFSPSEFSSLLRGDTNIPIKSEVKQERQR